MALRFSRLDRPAIRRLASGEAITEHGITASRLADGDVRYSVNIMVDGQRIHRVIGRESEGVTRTQVEEFIEAKRTEAREGRLALPRGRKTPLGFSDAAALYVERQEADPKAKNVKTKTRQLANYLKPFFADQRLSTITEFTIGQYMRRRRDAGAAPATVNRELATLNHLLGRAVAWKWLRAKPCHVEMFAEARGRMVTLSEQQADALLRAAIADTDPYCWLFVAFGLNTAMRHSEILSSRFDHVDFERRRLFIPRAKAGAREQPITMALVDILRREREMAADHDGWIFPAARPGLAKVGHRTRMDRPFRRAVEAAGLDPAAVTPHVMRHTAITRLVQAGVDLSTIQRISGHRTIRMVQHYTHLTDHHVDQAIAAIDRTIPQPQPNKPSGTVTQKLHAPVVGRLPSRR
jgi:integrase